MNKLQSYSFLHLSKGERHIRRIMSSVDFFIVGGIIMPGIETSVAIVRVETYDKESPKKNKISILHAIANGPPIVLDNRKDYISNSDMFLSIADIAIGEGKLLIIDKISPPQILGSDAEGNQQRVVINKKDALFVKNSIQNDLRNS